MFCFIFTNLKLLYTCECVCSRKKLGFQWDIPRRLCPGDAGNQAVGKAANVTLFWQSQHGKCDGVKLLGGKRERSSRRRRGKRNRKEQDVMRMKFE